MAPSKKTGTKAPRKTSQARGQTKGQRSQNPRNIPVASFRCFFCEGEKPLEEQVPDRKLPVCTNCHEHYTAVVEERAHVVAVPYTASPLPSSPSPLPTPLPHSSIRPAVVIGPSKGSKKKTATRLTAPKKPNAIIEHSQGPEKKVKLRLTAPKRPKPIIFLSLPGRDKILLSFPNPLRKKEGLCATRRVKYKSA